MNKETSVTWSRPTQTCYVNVRNVAKPVDAAWNEGFLLLQVLFANILSVH